MLQEFFWTAVFYAFVQRSNVWHGDVHIVGEEGAVEHGSLSAFADTCGYPLAVV